MRIFFITTVLFCLLIVPANAGSYRFTVAAHLVISKDIVHPGFKDSTTEIAGVPITARSVVVMDVETGKIIYSKKPFLKTPIASITKLMSLVTFIETGTSLGEIIEAKNTDLENLKQYVEEGDSVAHLSFYSGDKMYVRDAVYSGMVRSANNAVSTFVRATGLEGDEFVRRMNERAQVLGLYDTRFTEPTGLDSKNISTALDVAKLARHAFKNGFVRRVTTTRNYDFNTLTRKRSYQSKNTNDLLGMFQPVYYKVLGGKTGYLDESRYNVVTQIRNWQGKEVIVVVLGAESSDKRFWESKRLAVQAFREF